MNLMDVGATCVDVQEVLQQHAIEGMIAEIRWVDQLERIPHGKLLSVVRAKYH